MSGGGDLSVALACASAAGACIFGARLYFRSKIGHILTGPDRRKHYPIEEGLMPGARNTLKATDVIVKRELYTVAGEKYFCQTMASAEGAPSHVLVYFHGYCSSSDVYLEVFREIALKGALVVMPDLPCHGRSDGLLTYMPDWWEWVERIWQILDTVVPAAKSAYPSAKKVFVSGCSLGGGLTACLALQRPNFFDGIILIAPMLAVSDEVKPPKIVCDFFKYVVGPFKLTWPLSPSKSLSHLDFRISAQGEAFEHANPLSMQGHKPRLASALSMAFVFPEWFEEQMSEMRVPFLILHGTSDSITDPNISQRLHKVAASTDKQIKLYDGAFHCELLCCTPGNREFTGIPWEPEQVKCTQQTLSDMTTWMQERL